jgi:hypothetical protein
MNQAKPIPITNGTLVLDEEMLKEAHIENRARVIIKEGEIVVLSDEDVVEDTFGWIKIPTATAKYLAESKELE